MADHKDIYIYSTDLINLLLDSCTDGDPEVSDMMDCDCNQVIEDGETYDEVVDPECWYRVSWPEHVISPKFNSDATFHRGFDDEVRRLVESFYRDENDDAFESIHAHSCNRAHLFGREMLRSGK